MGICFSMVRQDIIIGGGSSSSCCLLHFSVPDFSLLTLFPTGLGWGFLAITLTSLPSVLAIVLVPLLNHNLFRFLLAFLVALAVGTLCGDALLHLWPHVCTVSTRAQLLFGYPREEGELREIDAAHAVSWCSRPYCSEFQAPCGDGVVLYSTQTEPGI